MQRVIIKGIRKWKNKKLQQFRRDVVNQIMFKILKDKISLGLGKIWVSTRKLQKVAKWVSFE